MRCNRDRIPAKKIRFQRFQLFYMSSSITWGDGYDLKFEIVKSILFRETRLENLRALTRPFMSSKSITKAKKAKTKKLIEEVQKATLDVVEKIMYWSLRFVKKTSFMWKSHSFLLLVLNSMDFLDRLELFPVLKFERNPLVRERSRLRGQEEVSGDNDTKVDLCELLLVEEENLCKPIPERLRCIWCGRVEEGTIVCFRRDCRKRFCDRCVEANSDESYEKASQAKSWRCFLCVESIRMKKRLSRLSPTSSIILQRHEKKTTTTTTQSNKLSPKSALQNWKRRMRAMKSKQHLSSATKDNALDLLLLEHSSP